MATGLLFSGQGAQHVGMARTADAVEDHPGNAAIGPVAGKAAHQGGGRLGLAQGIHHQNDGKA